MNLQLSLKTKWFEMTKAGTKTEDYRDINEYWCKRLFKYPEIFYVLNNNCIECKHRKDVDNMPGCSFDGKQKFECDLKKFEWNDNYFKPFEFNIMTLGYPKSTDTSRILKFEHAGIEIRKGKIEWGAEPCKLYFVIKHGELIK